MGQDAGGVTCSITVDGATSTCVLTLVGEADLAATDDLARALAEADATGCHTVIVDGRGLQFLDVHCLGLLVSFHENLASHGRQSLLTQPQPVVRTLLRVLETPLQVLEDPPAGRET